MDEWLDSLHAMLQSLTILCAAVRCLLRFSIKVRPAGVPGRYCNYMHLLALAFPGEGSVIGDSIVPGCILNCHLQLL